MANTLRVTMQPNGDAPAAMFEVLSAGFGGEQMLNIGSQSTGAGAGRVTFNPFTFSRRPDEHSGDLWSKMCSGTPYRRLSLEVAAQNSRAPFLMFTMGLVAVKTIGVSASADGFPLEMVAMEYGQMAYWVTVQNPDGSLGKPVGTGWDRVKNVSIDPAKVGA